MVKTSIEDVILENPFNNNSMLWEYIKCSVRTETMTYSSRRAKEKKVEENRIFEKLKKLEVQLDSHSGLNDREEYYTLKHKYEDAEAEKTNGAI